MKGKTPRIVMVVVALAMVASLIAGVTTGVSAEKPGVDERWTGFTLPSEVGYQLFPGTEVAHLELAADGTLIAAVYDQTFNRWGSPRGTVWGAVFVSTDGGYYWEFGWELPEDDPGQMVDLVAAPDYEHPGTVYLATQTYLYWSDDGCESFYRTYTACPGVSGNPDDGILGGVITSLDVAVDAVEQDEHVAVVGTSWGGLDGVYCWNIEGVPQWQDMEIGNRISAAFDTGNEGVLEVAFSPNYTEDRVIYAVANYDPCIIGPPWDITAPSDFTTVVTVYDGISGTWGIQYMDAAIWTYYVAAMGIAIGAPASWARIAFFDDFDIDNSPYAVVALSGCPTLNLTGMGGSATANADDIWQTKHLPPAVGPSSATDMDLVVTGTGIVPLYYSVEAYGMRSLTGTVLVGVEFPRNSGQAQVFVGTSPAVFPQWEPAMKPPTGGPGLWWNAAGTWNHPLTAEALPPVAAWTPVLGLQLSPGGVDVESDGSMHYVGTGENWGWSPSGVSVGRENMAGKFVWNGVGLLDTIVVTTDVLSWTNYAAVTYEEVSPHWANDGDDTLYISTWKHGFYDVFGFGTFNNTDQSIKGYWLAAVDADDNVMGGFWGWYYEPGVFTPVNGVIEEEGVLKVCAGDPIGACCQGTWDVSICEGFPMSAVSGTAGTVPSCSFGEEIVDVQGYLYAHDYGVDVWRNAPTGMDGEVEWERIAYENLVFPLEPLPPFKMFDGLTSGTTNPPVDPGWTRTEPLVAEEWFTMDGALPVGLDSIIVPRVPPDFEFDADMDADEYLFMLGGVTVRTPANPGVDLSMNALGYQDNLYFSFDGGESAWYASTMPAGAYRNGVTTPPPAGPGMSDTGWTVVDTKTVIMGDVSGYVWKTENGGNSWTDGIDTATGVVTDLNVSPIYSEDEEAAGADQAVVVGLWNQAVSAGQVWLSQDGAEEQFVQVGKDIVDDLMGPVADEPYPSKMVTNFDLNWEDNEIIYAGASGFFAAYCCGCPTPATVCEKGDAGVYRTDVDLGNPSDSIWELIYGVDQMMAEGLLPDAHPCSDRIWLFTDLEYQTPIGNGDDATVYIPFGILEWWPPYEIGGGDMADMDVQGRLRFALGGALRTLDGTKERVEWIGWDVLTLGLPRNPYCGLWLIRPVEGTNFLFSIPFQLDVMQERGEVVLEQEVLKQGRTDAELADYDIGLAIYEDTLCEDGPELLSPTDGKKKVGDLAGDLEKVNVILDWDAVISEATVTYEVQLDEDSKFNASERFVTATSAEDLGLVRQAVTTDTFAEFAGLENEFTYYWRVRVVDPALSPWSETWEFKTKASTITSVVTAPSIADGSPAPGATNVPLRPTFSWSAIGGVDYYELEVATDANFSDLAISEETEGTAYTPDSDLEKNTTYFWRVRGCTDDGECSDWSSTGVFTTGPEVQPGTPAWVWVVIVIGAILAIVVVILIVRTRRPA